MGKIEKIREITSKRKAKTPHGYVSVESLYGGRYDSNDWVSPWTKSACNVDAEIMLVAQDWGSTNAFSKGFDKRIASLGYSPDLPTNKRLFRLLDKYFHLDFSDTYATNLFVYLKKGALSARIPAIDMQFCVREFLIPQIDIVQPKAVLCLGAYVNNSVRKVLALPPLPLREAYKAPITYTGIRIFGLPHPGGLGTSSVGGQNAVEEMWRWVSNELKLLKK